MRRFRSWLGSVGARVIGVATRWWCRILPPQAVGEDIDRQRERMRRVVIEDKRDQARFLREVANQVRDSGHLEQLARERDEEAERLRMRLQRLRDTAHQRWTRRHPPPREGPGDFDDGGSTP